MSILYLLTGLLLGSLIPWTGDRMLLLAARPVPSQSNALLRRRFALAAGLLFALAWLRYGTTWQSILVCLACTFFLLLAVIDLKARLVLNVLVYPAVLIALLLQWLLPGGHLAGALIGGFFGLGLFWLVALLRPGELGMGDVKLAGLVGLSTGFPLVLWALLLTVFGGGAAALILLRSPDWNAKSVIPYAPFLCFGAIIALLFDPIPLLLAL